MFITTKNSYHYFNAKTCVKVRHLDNGGGWDQSANVKTDSLKRKDPTKQKKALVLTRI